MTMRRAWSVSRYREEFGWIVAEVDGRALLALGRSMVAVAVPAAIAPHVAAELKRQDANGPVIAVTGRASSWVFLADPNGSLTIRDELPKGVMVLDCPSRIPIPVGSSPPHQVRWIVSPDPYRRWLPTLAAVMCAVGRHSPNTCTLSRARGRLVPNGG